MQWYQRRLGGVAIRPSRVPRAPRLLIAVLCLVAALLAAGPANARAENHAPSCSDLDHGRVDNDTSRSVSFQCYDPENDTLSYMIVDPPLHGAVSAISSSTSGPYTYWSATYTPVHGYVGEDHFTYRANDGAADSEPGKVSFDLTDPSPPECTEPPAATIRTNKTGFFSLERSGNPSGCVGSPGKYGEFLSFRITRQPEHGALDDQTTSGYRTYTPNADYSGPDSFRYVAVGSGGDSNEVTQEITIDPDYNRAPNCSTGGFGGSEPTLRVGARRTFALSCSDPDGDPITYSLDRTGTRGTVGDPEAQEMPGGFPGLKQIAVAYTAPSEVGDGKDSFSYSATDDRGAGADPVAVQKVKVRAADYNTVPACSFPFTQQVETGWTAYLSTSCRDGEEDRMDYELASQPSHGHATLRKYEQPGGGQAYFSFEYESTEGYIGDDSFTYTVSDDHGGTTDPLTLPVKVVAPQPPQCSQQDTVKMHPNHTRGLMLLCLTGSSFGGGGKPPKYSIVDPPKHGTLSELKSNGAGSVVYTPDHDFEGDDSFTFKGSNSAGDSNVVEQKISVSSVHNSKPSCFGSFGGDRVRAGGSRTISLACYDNDGDPLSYTVGMPAHGTLGDVKQPTAGDTFGVATVEYTPDAGYTGEDSFTFKASDGFEESGPAPTAIDVVASDANFAPLCWGGWVVKVAANSTLALGKSELGCWDQDGDSFTHSIVEQPEHGTLSPPDAHGTRTYTPTDPTWTGEDSFTFRASDGRADSTAARMYVKVTQPVDVVAEPATLPSGEPVNLQNYVDSGGKSVISVPSGDVRQFPDACMPLDVDTAINPGSGSVDHVQLTLDPPGSGADADYPMTHGTGDEWKAHIDCVMAGDLTVEWDFTENGTTTHLSRPLGGIVLIDPQGVVYDKDQYDAAVSAGKTPDEARSIAAIEGATVELQRNTGGTWTKVPSGDPGISPNVNPQVTRTDGLFQWDVAAGAYRVVVSKPGYGTVTSAAVNIPPPVTNLHVAMTRVAVPPGGDSGGDGDGGSGGDGGGSTTTDPPASKPGDTASGSQPGPGPGSSSGPQTVPNPPPPAPKPGCAALKGKKKAECESRQRLKRALAKCSKLKGSKRATCVKRARARSKCDAMKGKKRRVCIRRANAIGKR